MSVTPGGLTDTAGASVALDVPARTLEDWRYKGEGPPFYRVGRGIRYDRGELAVWLAGRRTA